MSSKLPSPKGNIYEVTLLMAEHRRQKPDEWKNEVLPLKTSEEISKHCMRNWIWDGLEPYSDWLRKKIAADDLAFPNRRKYRG